MSVTKGAMYSTENRLDPKTMLACQKQLREAFDGEISAVSLKPIDFGDVRTVLPLERGYLTMFTQFLAGLEASTADIIFITEHDVMYPKEHFDFTPPRDDTFYYDLNWWKVRKDGLAVHWDAVQVSGICAYKPLLVDYYKKRIAEFDPADFDRKFEPTVDADFQTWRAPVPHIDIRHESNLTYNKWKIEHFRKKETAVNLEQSTIDKIPGWEGLREVL